MNQKLDPEEWPSICFEGEVLPQSLRGISILINRELTELTGDWIWSLRHCCSVHKSGERKWCLESATELIDHIIDHRVEVEAEVRERLGVHGFDGAATVDEWLVSLSRIQSLAGLSADECKWIAGQPMDKEEAELGLNRILTFIDRRG